MITDFRELPSSSTHVGSKAYVLAMMSQQGLRVPNGLILNERPASEADWASIIGWWKEQGMPRLAVRSSAFGEDSHEMSFAGQNQTFLNVQYESALRAAVESCFKSVDREASQVYRQFFLADKSAPPMNVVLQVMVDAKYAGVYFTHNPTKQEAGSVLEYVEGLGEALVSGQINPFQVFKESPQVDGPLSTDVINEVFLLGQQVEKLLAYPVDMEWAVGADSLVYLLQARPITQARSEVEQKTLLASELKRIEEKYPSDTWWDGQTFAEWTGQPTRLTFEVWRRAFTAEGAFDKALKELGYLGFGSQATSSESIMDRLFGHAYINMAKMVPLYFGPIPYRLEPKPKTHLKFEWLKISGKGIAQTPQSLWRMLSVGWKMSTGRRAWIDKSRKELVEFKHKMQRPARGDFYSQWEQADVVNLWQKEIANFSRQGLKWPLVLVILIEATHQSLRAILKSVVGEDQVEAYLQRWMGAGIKTASFEMNRYFARALEEPLKQEFFFSRFGHRGPGELDLSQPRWEELGEMCFQGGRSMDLVSHSELDVEAEIHALKTFKDVVLVEEWRLLKELLELREHWKMELMKPYAHIRYLTLELSKRFKLGNDIFQLTVEEISELVDSPQVIASIKGVISRRKLETQAYQGVYLPDVLRHGELGKCLEPTQMSASTYRGTPLSHGIVLGEVRVVSDPSQVDLSTWPENAILVAPATDPGWTALFTRSKGVIVERGGVLSHCAILARELGLPSLNLPRATQVLKNGDRIWLDAQQGGVKHVNA